MRTEDDIRASFRAMARNAPDVEAILTGLPEQDKARASGGRRRARRLLAPVAASAAVVAVIAASVAIATGGHGGGAPAVVTPGAEANVRGLPPYYVLIAASTTVRDTRNGAVLATVHPPRGQLFLTAAAGPDDNSFLLATWPSPVPRVNFPPSRLYLLRFNPAGHNTELIRLPIPAIPDVVGLTIAPGGNDLAVASSESDGSELSIYSLSGRLIRQWREPGAICAIRMACLYWASSGYLAFLWINNGTKVAPEGVSIVPATAASGSLLSASRLVVPFREFGAHGGPFETQTFVLSGDGATIAAAVTLPPSSSFEEFSATSGKLTGRFWQSPELFTGLVFWSNRTGSTLIVLAPFPRTTGHGPPTLGILAGERFTPLLTPPPGRWQSIAF